MNLGLRMHEPERPNEYTWGSEWLNLRVQTDELGSFGGPNGRTEQFGQKVLAVRLDELSGPNGLIWGSERMTQRSKRMNMGSVRMDAGTPKSDSPAWPGLFDNSSCCNPIPNEMQVSNVQYTRSWVTVFQKPRSQLIMCALRHRTTTGSLSLCNRTPKIRLDP